MISAFPGKVQNGVVVLDGGITFPDGTSVEVGVDSPVPNRAEKMSEEEHRQLMEIMDRIAAMLDENPGDTFSGADHDKALYGKPY